MLNKHIDIPLEAIVAFCEKYPIHKLSLFGSVLRDDFGPESDIDVLVEFEPDARISYFDLAGMQIELEGVIGRPVDIGTPEMLNKYIRNQVMESAKVVYEP